MIDPHKKQRHFTETEAPNSENLHEKNPTVSHFQENFGKRRPTLKDNIDSACSNILEALMVTTQNEAPTNQNAEMSNYIGKNKRKLWKSTKSEKEHTLAALSKIMESQKILLKDIDKYQRDNKKENSERINDFRCSSIINPNLINNLSASTHTLFHNNNNTVTIQSNTKGA